MEQIWNWLITLGRELDPVGTLIQAVVWFGTGVGLVWAYGRRRLISVEAETHKLKKDVEHWRGEFAKKEKEAENFVVELNSLRARLPEKVLEAADREIQNGNEERATRVLLDWLRHESPSIAALARRAAEWVLAFLPTGNDMAVATEARRLATLARTLNPNDFSLRALEAEVIALHAVAAERSGDTVASDDLWEQVLTYADSDAAAYLPELTRRGQAAMETGEYHLARVLWYRIWTICRRTLGPDYPQTLKSESNLASILHKLDRIEEAEEMHRRVYQTRSAKLGPNHSDTLTSQNNLALTLADLGRTEEAEKMLRQSWEVQKTELGPNHPVTLKSQNNLAVTLVDLGRREEAEEMQRRTWEAQKIVLGPDHVDTLTSQSNLALGLYTLNRAAEAEEMQRLAWEAMKATLGNDHPATLQSQHNLAVRLNALGRKTEAEPMYRQVWEARKSKLGPDHVDTLKSQKNLALTLHALGRTEEAEKLERRNRNC